METYIVADAESGLLNIKNKTIDMCITSPPYYGLRDYGNKFQIGLENTPEQYINKLVKVFRGVRSALKDDGTLWIVIGDSYAGSGKRTEIPGCKPKDLIGIPWMLAFALRADGWYLRQDIIWHKPNAMPESVKDRCTKSHEHILLLSKGKRYHFDADAITEPAAYDGRKETLNKGSAKYSETPIVPGNVIQTQHMAGRPHQRWRMKDGVHIRNKRDVWTVSTRPYKGAHFATFPPDLIRPCILAGSRVGGIVIDPFFGSGTTGMVAKEEQRGFIGIDISREYIELAKQRIQENGPGGKKGDHHSQEAELQND